MKHATQLITSGVLYAFILATFYPVTIMAAAEPENTNTQTITKRQRLEKPFTYLGVKQTNNEPKEVIFSQVNYVERRHGGDDDRDILEISGEHNGEPVTYLINSEAPRKSTSLKLFKASESMAFKMLRAKPDKYLLKFSVHSLSEYTSNEGVKTVTTHLDELIAEHFHVRLERIRNQ